ncbi:STX8 (predicted) [Pycnogonum litorale]
MGDTWLVDYDACDRLATDILEKINERNRYERHSSSYSQMSVKIRQAIKVFDNDVSNLKQNLLRASSSYYLTQREVERRQNMMDALAVREKQVRDYSSGRGPIVGSSALLGDGLPSGGGTVNWGYEETDETRDLTVDDIVNQQQQVIKEQDKGLETLYSVVSRQKQMAQNIGNEVDVQNGNAPLKYVGLYVIAYIA